MELLLLSTGFFSALLKFKQAINPCCLLEFALSILRQLGMSYRALFSSPLHIFFINSIIIVLILVSSRFHLPELEFAYDVFVGNLMDSLNVTTERWEGKTLPEDDAPSTTKETASSTTKVSDTKASTFLGNLGFDQEFLENDVQDDGEVTLKDIQVDCFRTLSGTWRVASTVDETPHLQNISKSYEIERAADKMEDTMEATWKAISQGQDKEKSIKLKKSDTWLGVARLPEPRSPAKSVIGSSEDSLEATWKELRKTVTFNDAVSASRRGGLARDLMSTSDEMKKRFDDFINNFNKDLRLQRQESEQRLLAAISRGL